MVGPLGAKQRLEPALLAFFPGTGLETRRNSSTVPLVWCWSMGLMFLPYFATLTKPCPYFTAKHTGAMGISDLLKVITERSRVRLKLTTLVWEPKTLTNYTKLLRHGYMCHISIDSLLYSLLYP